jgi:hypothetical protein
MIMTNSLNKKEKKIVIEPVMLTEEWPNKQLCGICQKRADKKITVYGNSTGEGIPRICRYCDYCIDTEVPHFRTVQ